MTTAVVIKRILDSASWATGEKNDAHCVFKLVFQLITTVIGGGYFWSEESLAIRTHVITGKEMMRWY